MGSPKIGTERQISVRRRQRAEYQRRSIRAHLERDDGTHLFERLLRTKSLICKCARGYRDAVVQPDLAGDTPRGTKNRFSVAERPVKFSVVSVEEEVGTDDNLLLSESTRGRKRRNERQKDSERRSTRSAHRACDGLAHALYNNAPVWSDSSRGRCWFSYSRLPRPPHSRKTHHLRAMTSTPLQEEGGGRSSRCRQR